MCALSEKTAKLLDKLDDGQRGDNEKLFGFNSANALVTFLGRKVNSVELPETNSIKNKKWQSHNIRVSRITNMKDRGYAYDKIMLVSGHKSLDSLMKYLKND